MTTETQKPMVTLRDGALKAVIWRNQTNKGLQYSVNFAKTYQDKEGKPKDTSYFSQSDLLKIAQLSAKAYDHVAGYREQDKMTLTQYAQ